MRKLLVLFVWCPLVLSGCIGVGAIVYKEDTMKSKGSWAYNSTKEELIQRLGKPSNINKTSDTEEILVYNNSLRVRGVIPFFEALIIPVPGIPIFMPKHDWTEYYVTNNRISGKIDHFTTEKTCLVRYMAFNEGEGPRWRCECR